MKIPTDDTIPAIYIIFGTSMAFIALIVVSHLSLMESLCSK